MAMEWNVEIAFTRRLSATDMYVRRKYIHRHRLQRNRCISFAPPCCNAATSRSVRSAAERYGKTIS